MSQIPLPLMALTLGLASACGSYTAPANSPNAPPPAAMANDISIVAGASTLTTTAFSPNPKTVSLSGNSSITVRWVNNDITGGDYTSGSATVHNITSDNGAFPASGNLGGNATFSTVLTATGSYAYHCAIHPNMVGTVTVNP
ncbi:MAG: plastocyanin/azurin family copper-binding protein [Gemmatimonadales bacterium]